MAGYLGFKAGVHPRESSYLYAIRQQPCLCTELLRLQPDLEKSGLEGLFIVLFASGFQAVRVEAQEATKTPQNLAWSG